MARIESTEVAAAEVANMGMASLDVVTPDGSIDFGPLASPGSEMVVTYTGDGSGDGGCVKLRGTGDTESFLITKINGTALPAPFDLGSGDYFLPTFASGGSVAVTYEIQYTDGTGKGVTLEVLSFDGSADIHNINGTARDPYVAAAADNGTHIAVYSPAQLATGTILTATAAMEDVSGNGEGDLITTLTGAGVGTWSVETANAPGVDSLSKVLKTTRLRFDDAHAITALFGSDVQTVGFLLRYVGTTDAGTMMSNINQSAGAPLRLESIGSNAQVNMSDGVTFNIAVTGMAQDNWYYVTARRGAGGAIDLEVTDLEAGTPTLGDHGSNSQGAGSWDAAEWQRFVCGGYGAGTGTMEMTGPSFWSDRLTDGQVQNVIDGVVTSMAA